MPAAIDEEIVACLSEAVKTMVLENLSVDHFEKVLHRLRRPVSEPVGLRNELGPDFVDDPDMLTFINMSLLKSAGLGYPKDIEECRAIASSLNRLRKSCGCSPIFFGRITTSGVNDYYVAYYEAADKVEYYCRVGFGGDWRLLPEPTLVQSGLVGRINYRFTGNLGVSVMSHPQFGGTEDVFLAATVKRILQESTVFSMQTENRVPTDRIVPSIHCCQPPRLSAFSRLVATGKYKPLDRDQPGSWEIEYVGDPSMYINQQDADICLGKVVIRSMSWLGAVFVVSDYLNRGVNMYDGTGMRMDGENLLDIMPPLSIQPEIQEGDLLEFSG